MSQTYLEKALQPPYLENTFSNDHGQLEKTPPLDSAIRALSGIPVNTLANHNVSLFIPNLRQTLRKLADYRDPLAKSTSPN